MGQAVASADSRRTLDRRPILRFSALRLRMAAAWRSGAFLLRLRCGVRNPTRSRPRRGSRLRSGRRGFRTASRMAYLDEIEAGIRSESRRHSSTFPGDINGSQSTLTDRKAQSDHAEYARGGRWPLPFPNSL